MKINKIKKYLWYKRYVKKEKVYYKHARMLGQAKERKCLGTKIISG